MSSVDRRSTARINKGNKQVKFTAFTHNFPRHDKQELKNLIVFASVLCFS